MRVLVTGAHGQLGRHLLRNVPSFVTVLGVSRSDCDITRPDVVASVLKTFSPNVVINAAAYTAVDRAESDQSGTFAVNSLGARNVGVAAKEFGVRVIHISTDYVFDGLSTRPYRPTDAANPLNVYGKSKREGEIALASVHPKTLIVRTGWLYSTFDQSFVTKILKRLASATPVKVVNDQVGAPTSAADLASALWECVSQPAVSGIQHWVNSGTATWNELATRIRTRALELGILSEGAPILPVSSDSYGLQAIRPAYSVLDAEEMWSALGKRARHWHAALDDVLEELC